MPTIVSDNRSLESTLDEKNFYAILVVPTDLTGDVYSRIKNIRARITTLEAVPTDEGEYPHTRRMQISTKIQEFKLKLKKEATLLRDILAVVTRESL